MTPAPHDSGRFASVPDVVRDLAVCCFLKNLDPRELVRLDLDSAFQIGEEAGLTRDEFLAAIAWLGSYNEQHAATLRRCMAAVGQAV